MKNLKYSFLLLSMMALSACGPSVHDGSPIASLGNDNAPILVEEFSDIECPACANVSPQLEQVILNNAQLARLEYRHYPLPQHQNAFMAAEAAECAADQGEFWDYLKWAFENQSALDEINLKNQAADMGLDANTFNECLDSGAKKGKIRSDIAEGRKRQLQYTPSIYVNGQLVGWEGPEAFEAYLKSLKN